MSSRAPVTSRIILLSCNTVNYLLMTFIAHGNKPGKITWDSMSRTFCCSAKPLHFMACRLFYALQCFLRQRRENQLSWRSVMFQSSVFWHLTWHAVCFQRKRALRVCFTFCCKTTTIGRLCSHSGWWQIWRQWEGRGNGKEGKDLKESGAAFGLHVVLPDGRGRGERVRECEYK